MDVSGPIKPVIPSAHGPVLGVLAHADRALPARVITELIEGRASRRHVDTVLGQLVAAGLVIREREPPFSLYRLNREHVAAPAVEALAGVWEELLRRISAEVEGWPVHPSAVWLFGSAARGDGDVESDIDLLLIRPDSVDEDEATWNEGVGDLANKVTRWTGNDCQVAEYSETRFAALVQSGEGLVADLRRDAIRITGDTVSQRTRARRPRAS